MAVMIYVNVLDSNTPAKLSHMVCFDGDIVYGADNLKHVASSTHAWESFLYDIKTNLTGNRGNISWFHCNPVVTPNKK